MVHGLRKVIQRVKQRPVEVEQDKGVTYLHFVCKDGQSRRYHTSALSLDIHTKHRQVVARLGTIHMAGDSIVHLLDQ